MKKGNDRFSAYKKPVRAAVAARAVAPSKPIKAVPSCLDPAGLALLDQGLAAIDPRLSDPVLRQDLLHYVRELELWNPRLGLVEASGHELIVRHLLDCLAAVPLLLARLGQRGDQPGEPKVLRLADIGSGAGLPGVLLALALKRLMARPCTVVLVEKQQRRVGFLLNVKAMIGISNLEVCQDSLEAIALAQGGSFDLVTARAFRPLEPGVVGELGCLLAANGELFLYKGRHDRISEELASAGLGASSGIEIVQLKVPSLDEERHVVLVPRAAISPSSGA